MAQRTHHSGPAELLAELETWVPGTAEAVAMYYLFPAVLRAVLERRRLGSMPGSSDSVRGRPGIGLSFFYRNLASLATIY